MTIDYDLIRKGIVALPRSGHHSPGQSVDPGVLYAPWSHRNALDPDRALVVGNRGMGKSFWAHALLQAEIRDDIAKRYEHPTLRQAHVVIGFNASEQAAAVAPSPAMLDQVAKQKGADAETIWRAVLTRAASRFAGLDIPESFPDLVGWVLADAQRYSSLMTRADAELQKSGVKLVVVFDALERLGGDWPSTRVLAKGLLRQALAVKSFGAIRIKLFMRPDQFEDNLLFGFPDASKIKNDRVNLDWGSHDLYGLLFHHLSRSSVCQEAFAALCQEAGFDDGNSLQEASQKRLVIALAGEYMGAGKKRGSVYSWLPLHLADAKGQTSPRTFLTAWREAAAFRYDPPPSRAVDHRGISDGVRKASEDRLNELKEDYPWIDTVLTPLRDQLVPMERAFLEELWRKAGTASRLVADSHQDARLLPVQLVEAQSTSEAALMSTLQAIGVLEIRANGKINVPDIFRIDAGIKRKGGVPKRRQ